MGFAKKLAKMLTPPDPDNQADVDRAVKERRENIEKARLAGEKARRQAAATQAAIDAARNPPRAIGH